MIHIIPSYSFYFFIFLPLLLSTAKPASGCAHITVWVRPAMSHGNLLLVLVSLPEIVNSQIYDLRTSVYHSVVSNYVTIPKMCCGTTSPSRLLDCLRRHTATVRAAVAPTTWTTIVAPCPSWWATATYHCNHTTNKHISLWISEYFTYSFTKLRFISKTSTLGESDWQRMNYIIISTTVSENKKSARNPARKGFETSKTRIQWIKGATVPFFQMPTVYLYTFFPNKKHGRNNTQATE